jgi:hypothetical protein
MIALRSVLGGWLLAIAAAAGGGCGTDAVGTDTCRRIEQARCRKAPACPALGVTHVEVCVQFARDRCLHGLAGPEPATSRVEQCTAAIEQATTCSIVEAPETDPACSFLSSAPASEAGASEPAEASQDSTAPSPESAPDAAAESSALEDASDGG